MDSACGYKIPTIPCLRLRNCLSWGPHIWKGSERAVERTASEPLRTKPIIQRSRTSSPTQRVHRCHVATCAKRVALVSKWVLQHSSRCAFAAAIAALAHHFASADDVSAAAKSPCFRCVIFFVAHPSCRCTGTCIAEIHGGGRLRCLVECVACGRYAADSRLPCVCVWKTIWVATLRRPVAVHSSLCWTVPP